MQLKHVIKNIYFSFNIWVEREKERMIDLTMIQCDFF